MAVKNYSLADVKVIWGPIEFGGYGEEGGIEIEQDEDNILYTPNADGGGTRAINKQQSATVRITLAQSSETNSLLSVAATTDRLSGTGVYPFLLRDKNGTSLHASTSLWIQKEPMAGYNKNIGTREWTFRTDEMVSFYGQNNEI